MAFPVSVELYIDVFIVFYSSVHFSSFLGGYPLLGQVAVTSLRGRYVGTGGTVCVCVFFCVHVHACVCDDCTGLIPV